MTEAGSATYFLILLFSLAYPLAQTFEHRLEMRKRLPYLLPGILIAMFPFIIWDIRFARNGIWGFNPNYTSGLSIADLPLEEWLFFLIVPYACFFIFEVLRYFIRTFYFPRTAHLLIILLLVFFSVLLPFTLHLSYTRTALLFVIPLLALQLLLKTYRSWFPGFLLMYAVSLIPFLLVNGVLTALPVVWYNNAENLGIRIFTIPIEDLIYLLGMLLPAMNVYQFLLNRSGRTEQKSAPQSGF